MTKAELNTLQPGMKFKVVDQWPSGGRQNGDGGMDKWLGTVMTVEFNDGYWIRAEEDLGDVPWDGDRGWNWYPELIDCIICDDDASIQEPDDSDMLSFLFQ